MIVHGLKDHCGRYEHVARALADGGYAAHAFDLRGHGRSDGDRYYVERFEEYASDLSAFAGLIRSPRRQLFILAHSMGAVVACRAVLDGEVETDGLVLSGAALLPGRSVSPLLVRSAALLGRYLPRLRVVRLDVRGISRDPRVVRRALSDPLTDHGPSPARTGYELLRAAGVVLDRAGELRDPMLILHGGADPLADPEGSRRLHESSSEAPSTLKVYPGLLHEVLNEPEGEEVMGDVLSWLDARSSALEAG